jgi:D-lactate dehydrogenase
VSADGRAFTTGVKTTKGVVGYDLTRLLIGSEGTLAVITEATLRLTPRPEAKRTLRAIYRDVESAAEAVVRLMGQPVTPCALEFMDHRAIEMIRDYPEAAALPTDAGALLMIEVDGPAAYLEAAEAAVRAAAAGHGLLRVESASDPAEVKALWATRKALSPALRHVAPKKINEDVAVPVANIPALVRALEGLATRYGITIVNFGHAGNGNLHVNLLIDPEDPGQAEAAQGCLSEVFDQVLALEGTLSGEHGVGLEKRDYVDRELDPVALELMHRLKATFDPRGILNPGKGLPDPHPAPSPS